MQCSTLSDWLAHLESLHPKTIALGLERVAQVQNKLKLTPIFPVIIVGGTNGKGSVCAMLESMLHAAGYKVGCYTSPHLTAYNERVRIAKRQVTDAELCDSFSRIEAGRGDVALTYFEFGTLAAMQCFMDHNVDVAILEVGLGGRLDAVNLFDADCAVVTSVDIDHTDYLGETREEIGHEKAGIFRAGKVAICAEREVPQSLRKHAEEIGATLWCIDNQFGHVRHQGQWDFRCGTAVRSSLPYPALRGAFQLDNASAALAALEALRARLPVSAEAVRRGLVEVNLAGRFQVMPGRPQLILDVAHNPHAARSLAHNLSSLPPARTLAVCAMLKDKDIAGVVGALDGQINEWFVAGILAVRGATAEELQQVLVRQQVRGAITVCESISDALRQACNAAAENDRIVAFGSFYTVAEVMGAHGCA